MPEQLSYRSKIEEAHALLQEGRLAACVKVSGSLLESAFRQVYEKLMLHLSVPQRIEIMHIEDEITQSKGVQQAGLGQLYGIFEKADLFKALAKKQGQRVQAIARLDFSNLIYLRNQVTHQAYQPDLAEASLCFFTVYQFLKLALNIDWVLPEPVNTLEPSPAQLTPLDSYRYLLEMVWQKGYAQEAELDYLRQKAHAFDLRYQEVERLERAVQAQFKQPEKIVETPSTYTSQVEELMIPVHALPAERYQIFFQSVLDGLKQRVHWVKLEKAQPKSALDLRIGYGGYQVGASFARHGRLRIELYIDTGERQENKQAFDRLQQFAPQLEAALGTLEWERLDNRRASRIAWYIAGDIQDEADRLKELRDLAIQRLIDFYSAFTPVLSQASQSAALPPDEHIERWQARTGQHLLQRLQEMTQLLTHRVGPLVLDLSSQSCFKFRVQDQDWIHLWPRKNGFTLYLPDPESEADLPSEDYADFFDCCEALAIAVRWQTEYDQGKHPVHCVVTDDQFQDPVFLKALKHNYDTFCRNQSG